MHNSISDSNTTDTKERGLPNYVSTRTAKPKKDDITNDFSKFKNEIKDLLTSFMSTQQSELKIITTNLKEIHQTNNNIESAIANLSIQNEELRKKIESLEQQRKKDRDYITLLETKIEDSLRCARKSSIELKNVPRSAKENCDDLINMISHLSKNICLDIDTRDIKDIYRLPVIKAGVTATPIIVELGSALLKTNLLKKVKSFNIKNKSKLQAQHLGLKSCPDVPVFVSEQLTPTGARLFFLARDLARTKKYKYCWTSYGRVYIRKDENTQVLVLKSETQIQQLLHRE